MFKKIIVWVVIVGIIIFIVPLIISIFSDDRIGGPDYSSVSAYITEEYYQAFDAKEYVLEDFNLINATRLEYRYFGNLQAQDGTGIRYFKIYLNTTRKQEAQSALDHLIGLEFIDSVSFNYQGVIEGTLLD